MAEGYSGNTPGGEQKTYQEELDNFHALKKEFDQGSAQISLVHDLVCAAGSIGQTRELIAWMVQNHGSSTTGLLAIISLLLDMGDKATAEQVVGDAISVHAMYGDYLFHFAEFLVSKKEYMKSCIIMHWLCSSRPEDKELHRLLVKTLYRLGDYQAHHTLSQLCAERFSNEFEFGLEDIRAQVYRPDISRQTLHQMRREWASHVSSKIPESVRPLPRQTNKLRVALVGEYIHPMFLEPLLRHYDRDKIALEVYTNDSRIEKIWDGQARPLPVDDLENLAVQMRALQVDIVIEMTARINELKLLSHRPAPLQGGWITTNLTQPFSFSDFVIADPVIIPLSQRSDWSEQIVDLPVWAPFTFYDGVPDVKPCPSESNGFITFGACQRAMKFNDNFLGVWAKLLQEVSGSRLVLKDQSFSDPMACVAMLSRCRNQGIDTDRLTLEPGTAHPEYYEYYHGIDVSLDTSPYGGGILTAESLWMGVPVVTLSGDRFNARLAHTYLSAVGHEEWVTNTQEAYIQKVIDVAHDIGTRRRFRTESRAQMQRSSIMQYEAFARSFEVAMLSLHEQHLAACE
jgi:predicted O-linked N-acetylglucosamine transferase (SPINDLY family)